MFIYMYMYTSIKKKHSDYVFTNKARVDFVLWNKHLFVENCSIFSEEKYHNIYLFFSPTSINKTVNKLLVFMVGIAGSGTCLIHELTPILIQPKKKNVKTLLVKRLNFFRGFILWWTISNTHKKEGTSLYVANV